MPFPKFKSAVTGSAHLHEWTDVERGVILEEVDRILSDHTFKNSKRCQILFRSLVDHALANDEDGVKERILGVEVFGREPDYDTATDPIVRMAANEIRKRLGQWYQEAGRQHQVKISLYPGAYLLKFEFIQQYSSSDDARAKPAEEASASASLFHGGAQPSNVTLPAAPFSTRIRWIYLLTAVFTIGLAVVLSARHFETIHSKDYETWSPFLASRQPVTICVPDDYPLGFTDGKTSQQTISDWQSVADMITKRENPAVNLPHGPAPNTPLADAEVGQRISTWLATHGGRSAARGSSGISLRDFSQGPAVLIGGFNPWSLILLSNLRFSMRVDPDKRDKWIQDAQNPSKRDWILEGGNQKSVVDYAIVTRVFDTETGQWILALGGLRRYGTQAASELLTNPSYISLLPAELRSTGNFQIVLKTSVINDGAGPPEVIAVHTW
jgi:hypothetical protein